MPSLAELLGYAPRFDRWSSSSPSPAFATTPFNARWLESPNDPPSLLANLSTIAPPLGASPFPPRPPLGLPPDAPPAGLFGGIPFERGAQTSFAPPRGFLPVRLADANAYSPEPAASPSRPTWDAVAPGGMPTNVLGLSRDAPPGLSGHTDLSPDLFSPSPLAPGASPSFSTDAYLGALDALARVTNEFGTAPAIDPSFGARPPELAADSAAPAESPGLLGRIGDRISQNFRDAYAEPLGPGAGYRSFVSPFVNPSGSWTDHLGAPFRTFNQALLLGLPDAADAALRSVLPSYYSLIDSSVEALKTISTDPGGVERTGRELKALPEAFPGVSRGLVRMAPFAAALPIIPGRLIGQVHHAISKTVHDALEAHDNLKGLYRYKDPRFISQAIDRPAHIGWGGWHRALDKEIATYVMEQPNLTQRQFEDYLRWRYDQSDLRARFPNGLR